MKYSTLIILLSSLYINISAQVKFQLDFEEESETYTISLIPETTYSSPENLTGTGQITIKVPTNDFDVHNLINLHPDMMWFNNSV